MEQENGSGGAQSGSGGAQGCSGMGGIDLKVLKRILKFMDESGLVELDVEAEGVKVRLRKAGAGVSPSVPVDAFPVQQVGAASTAPAASATAPAPVPVRSDIAVVKAPMVGTFYRSPAPTSPPFVNVGDIVKEGQTMCILEAMKLMNEIKAEKAGKVATILVENGQPVEFDQVLFELEPAGA